MQPAVFYAKTDSPLPDATLRALRSMTNDALGLDTNSIMRACTCALGHPPVLVQSLRTQGTFHRLFFVTGPEGERFVLRVNAISDEMRDLNLHVEAQVARLVADSGIPVAEPVYVDTSRQSCPFDFAMLRWIPGQNLGSFDRTEETTLQLLKNLGAMVAHLHGIRPAPPGFGSFRSPASNAGKAQSSFTDTLSGSFGSWHEYLHTQLETHVDVCTSIGALNGAFAAQVRSAFRTNRFELRHADASVLHGDLGSHNIMTDGDAVIALLDWEDSLAGDPIYDIAFWATFHPERRHTAFLAGYRENRDLPADFQVRFWLYFLRVALAKTVHRHRFGYTDPPGREPAARRIQLALTRLQSAL